MIQAYHHLMQSYVLHPQSDPFYKPIHNYYNYNTATWGSFWNLSSTNFRVGTPNMSHTARSLKHHQQVCGMEGTYAKDPPRRITVIALLHIGRDRQLACTVSASDFSQSISPNSTYSSYFARNGGGFDSLGKI